MTNANRNNKEQLVATLSLLISELEEKIKEYLNSFDMNSAFSFSNNEETRKKHLRVYNTFCSTLNKYVEKCEQQMALISDLIHNVDNACDKELTEELIMHFEKYIVFSMAVSRFMENSKIAFFEEKDNFRQHVVVSCTRELLAAIQNYKKNI